MKASDNQFPSILVTEQASKPAAPVAGDQRLYMKTDHKLYHENSAGAETEVGSGTLITSALLLNYTGSTDLWDGASLSAGSWQDLSANQNFVVANAAAVIAISVIGNALAGNNAASKTLAVRIIIDSGGTPITKTLGAGKSPANGYVNILGGNSVIYLTGLSAATHTVKVQINPTGAVTGYCRCQTLPDEEFLIVQVVQLT